MTKENIKKFIVDHKKGIVIAGSVVIGIGAAVVLKKLPTALSKDKSDAKDVVEHYSMPIRSGRYPWGSRFVRTDTGEEFVGMVIDVPVVRAKGEDMNVTGAILVRKQD